MNAHRLFFVLPSQIGSALEWLPLLVARAAVGWTFVQTGWGKLSDLAPVVEFFRDLGIPYPELQAPFVASVELTCGALLCVGLFSRIAALPLIGTMVVAIATAQWENVDSLSALFGLEEFLYIVIFGWIFTSGAGPVSLDRLIEPVAGTPRKMAPAIGEGRKLEPAAA
jgi:putative oxidoreductase